MTAGKKFQEVALTGDEVVKTQELREQCRNAARFKSAMVHAAGGVFGEEAVRALLELPSKEAVHQAVRQTNLLAVEDNDRLWFPKCQFQGGTVYPGIRAILKRSLRRADGGSCSISTEEWTVSPAIVQSTSSKVQKRTLIAQCALRES